MSYNYAGYHHRQFDHQQGPQPWQPPPYSFFAKRFDSCAVCGLLTKKQCAGCKMVKYCSEACQQSHWTEHKTRCNRYLPPQPVLNQQPPPQHLPAAVQRPAAATSLEKRRQLPDSSQPGPNPKMDDSDVSKQIKAEEIANEIFVSTKSEEEPNLSSKLDLELSAKISTISSDLELPTISDLELSVEISTVSDLELSVEQGDSDNDVASDEGVTFSIILVQHDHLSPATPTKMSLLLRRRYTRKRSRQWRRRLMALSPLCFSDFHLEDKVYFNRGGVDTDIYSTSSNFLHNPP